MDHETNKQEPSSKEGGEMKVGDEVWVKARIEDARGERVQFLFGGNWALWLPSSDCRPVEPEAVEQDLPKFSPGDRVRVASPSHEWHGKLGEVLCFDTQGDDFISYMVKLHNLDYAVPISSHLMRLNNPSPSKEPTRGQRLAEQALKGIWAANDSVNEPPVVEACTKTANDQLRQSLMDYPFGEPEVIKDSLTTKPNSPKIPDSSSDPLSPSPCMDGVKVGDAVRFVSPGHKRHGTEGAITSIGYSGSKYRFDSNCGQFYRWCAITELKRIDKADPINPSHYKQGGIECIEAIKAAIGDGFIGYVWGNVLKYLWRWPKKGGVDDLKKARWYLDRLIKEVGE